MLALNQANESQESWQRVLPGRRIRSDFAYGPFFNMGIWVTPTKANIRRWFEIGANHGDAYCAWKLSILYLDGFFGEEEALTKGAEWLQLAMDRKLPHAVWYGATIRSDPGHPLYFPEMADKLKSDLVDLQFPPAGPFIMPDSH